MLSRETWRSSFGVAGDRVLLGAISVGLDVGANQQGVHTIREQSERTTVSSDTQSALNVELW
jgi:hypothetical protein